jgi:signal transduction histidine kinase
VPTSCPLEVTNACRVAFGISPERAPNIFERFYRARGDEQTPGHGLGLSIARELARAHSGNLTLISTQSDWTEFCLRLSASSIHVQTQKPPPTTQE